jgi:hypothetical protein
MLTFPILSAISETLIATGHHLIIGPDPTQISYFLLFPIINMLQIVALVITVNISIFFLEKKHNLHTYSVYIKLMVQNLKVLYHHHVCNCWIIKNISSIIYINVYNLHTKFRIHSSNSVLVITVWLKAKWKCSHDHNVVSYSGVAGGQILNKSYIFSTGLLPYVISGPYIKGCYCLSHLTSLCIHHN